MMLFSTVPKILSCNAKMTNTIYTSSLLAHSNSSDVFREMIRTVFTNSRFVVHIISVGDLFKHGKERNACIYISKSAANAYMKVREFVQTSRKNLENHSIRNMQHNATHISRGSSSRMLLKMFVIVELTIYKLLMVDASYSHHPICNIYSDQYSGERLYAASSEFKPNRFVRPTFTLETKPNSNFTYDASNSQAAWQLIRVPNRKNTFLIRNVKFNEYLYVAEDGVDNFRRQVFTKFSPVTNYKVNLPQHKHKSHHRVKDDAKMWTFKEHFGGNQTHDLQQPMYLDIRNNSRSARVTICNVKFGEALYASSFLHVLGPLSHIAYTWRRAPDSGQFNWFLICNVLKRWWKNES